MIWENKEMTSLEGMKKIKQIKKGITIMVEKQNNEHIKTSNENEQYK